MLLWKCSHCGLVSPVKMVNGLPQIETDYKKCCDNCEISFFVLFPESYDMFLENFCEELK